MIVRLCSDWWAHTSSHWANGSPFPVSINTMPRLHLALALFVGHRRFTAFGRMGQNDCLTCRGKKDHLSTGEGRGGGERLLGEDLGLPPCKS